MGCVSCVRRSVWLSPPPTASSKRSPEVRRRSLDRVKRTEVERLHGKMGLAGLRELWAETLGDPRICIAILDGPVDRSHPSLVSAKLTRLDTLVPAAADHSPATQHGTHITSVIFGGHDGPVKGLAPLCRGLILPIFRGGATGDIGPSSQLDLARAISQAVQKGAHVINISGGEFSPSGTAHPILANAVRDCASRGVLIVAAAGNDGCDCLHIPGALPSVLAVGAMDSTGAPLHFSNWGTRYLAQGILAPGENIEGARSGGGTALNSGTSYATPVVWGVAALLLSLQLKLGRKPDPGAVRASILESAIGCDAQPVGLPARTGRASQRQGSDDAHKGMQCHGGRGPSQ